MKRVRNFESLNGIGFSVNPNGEVVNYIISVFPNVDSDSIILRPDMKKDVYKNYIFLEINWKAWFGDSTLIDINIHSLASSNRIAQTTYSLTKNSIQSRYDFIKWISQICINHNDLLKN